MICAPFTFNLGNGHLAAGIICGSGRVQRCRWCRRPATKLCDAAVPRRRSGTCDAPMCDGHATPFMRSGDLCPGHVADTPVGPQPAQGVLL